MLKLLIKPILLLFLLIFFISSPGCLKKPYYPGQDYGALHVILTLAEEAGVLTAGASGIDQIIIRLLYKGGRITRQQTIAYTPGLPVEASFSSLYPGEWEVTAEALDNEEDVILSGGREVIIEPGSSGSVELRLTPAPGFLALTFDASGVPGFGTEITGGKLYVYLDPTSGQSTSYSLTREGNLLTICAALPAGTFPFRVAVPQISSPVYTSPYYTCHIRPGKTVFLSLAPDEELIITGIIDLPPAAPTGLSLEYAGSSTILISWEEVGVPDLAGYRLYRTNNEGRFVRHAEIDGGPPGYTDTVSGAAYFGGQIGYAVSSFDQGGNESLWSDPAYLPEP